jgi:Na+-translocating ferredoxin:NAD+ oxidoreductase RnfC subunit
MGKVINWRTAAVSKTTKGILIIPAETRAVEAKSINEKAAVARAETACCQCTRCTDLCPRHLLGYPLEPHKMVRTAMGAAKVSPALVVTATLCCGCGICESLACSQGISPKAVINNYKALLRDNRMRFLADKAYSPRPEREYRMIPSSKWAQDIGIAKFDTVADYLGKLEDFKAVEIPLTKHIGIPSAPTVVTGDTVTKGQLIAKAADGLSVPQHAPFDGKVRVLGDRIIIERVDK